MPERTNWKRLAVEAVVIVASILLAFGIEAWWDEQSERRDERVELIRVRDELTSDRDRLSGFGRFNDQAAVSSLAMLQLIAELPGASGTGI